MLQVKNIHKSYDNGKKSLSVLKGIDLTISKGEFAAITGPSGAGKSTLLHIMGGLDAPDQGEVVFEGENIYKLASSELDLLRNRRLGFVFQFYHLLSEFTVLENVVMPAWISPRSTVPACPAGRDGPRLKEEAMALLREARLDQRVDHFPSQLSGGEKQRVAIVRALINHPEVVLCDEPTGNLDSATGEEVISLIKKMRKNNQMTVVLVTHNLELAKTADKMYRLRDGQLVN